MSDLQRFIEAIQQGNDSLVNDVLSDDPSLVEAKTSSGVSMILLATYYSQHEIAQLLAGKKSDLTIFEAAAVGNFQKLMQLVEADPTIINTFSEDGFPPLGLASFFGHSELADYLIRSGADVNLASKNRMQVMPLHAAVANQHLEIARMLLEHGAWVNAVQQDSFTPLHGAAQNGQIELIRLLLDYGADPHLRTADGRTSLDMAEAAGHGDAAVYLRID